MQVSGPAALQKKDEYSAEHEDEGYVEKKVALFLLHERLVRRVWVLALCDFLVGSHPHKPTDYHKYYPEVNREETVEGDFQQASIGYQRNKSPKRTSDDNAD